MLHVVVVVLGLMVGHVAHGSQEYETRLLRRSPSNAVIIHIKSTTDIHPDPEQLLEILSHDVDQLPGAINNLILEYARWEPDHIGEAQKKEWRSIFRELIKTQLLSSITFMGGVAEVAGFCKAGFSSGTNRALVPAATSSWEVPLVSVLLGSSLIACCADYCLNAKSRAAYKVVKREARLVGSLVSICAIGALLANLIGTDDGIGSIPCLAIGGVFGASYPIWNIAEARRIKRRLQFLELRQHVREQSKSWGA